MTHETHPVWTVYDKLRTARLNVKYYSRRLQTLERQNFLIELVLLATAPSSAVAGLWFWEAEYGKVIWQYFGIVAAVTAVLKPLLNLTKRIKEFESVLSGYRTLEYDLMEIKSLVEQKKKYDSALQSEFKKSLQREKALASPLDLVLNHGQHRNRSPRPSQRNQSRPETLPALIISRSTLNRISLGQDDLLRIPRGRRRCPQFDPGLFDFASYPTCIEPPL